MSTDRKCLRNTKYLFLNGLQYVSTLSQTSSLILHWNNVITSAHVLSKINEKKEKENTCILNLTLHNTIVFTKSVKSPESRSDTKVSFSFEPDYIFMAPETLARLKKKVPENGQ